MQLLSGAVVLGRVGMLVEPLGGRAVVHGGVRDSEGQRRQLRGVEASVTEHQVAVVQRGSLVVREVGLVVAIGRAVQHRVVGGGVAHLLSLTPLLVGGT